MTFKAQRFPNLARRISAWMVKGGYSLRVAALLLGVSAPSLSRLLRNKSVSVELAGKADAALDKLQKEAEQRDAQCCPTCGQRLP